MGEDNREAGPRMTDVEDWALVARAREGDSAAFAGLVRRYQNPVLHFCYRMTGSREDAEELAQDAFVRVYRHLPRLEPKARFTTVLFGIARNLALNAVRDAKRRGRDQRVRLEDGNLERACGDEGLRPDRQARLGEMEALLNRGIEQLSPDHREVLLLRELQGLDYEAIAEICGCPVGTVRSRLARAREELRQRVTAALGGREL